MRQLLLLGLAFTIFVAAVSAGTTYGMIQAFGGGPRGEQGVTGSQGDQGVQGLRGADGTSAVSDTSANSLSIQVIANALALTLISDHNPGRTVKSGDADVKACTAWLISATGSFTECGLTRNP